MSEAPGDACATCPAFNAGHLTRLGINLTDVDYVVALAGNPNTGKSTVFNALTGLRQHTGNWPGKTVSRAEGGFAYGGKRFKIVDLPGTYSLLSTSADEEVARDFILFGTPDVTVIVVDATRLERNLNLVLQVLEITERAVLCVNLIDEARRHRIQVDQRTLARDLGIPVVLTAARQREGIDDLLRASPMLPPNDWSQTAPGAVVAADGEQGPRPADRTGDCGGPRPSECPLGRPAPARGGPENDRRAAEWRVECAGKRHRVRGWHQCRRKFREILRNTVSLCILCGMEADENP
jgi:ferrous iron transport protein B